jgi:hypothetical protein
MRAQIVLVTLTLVLAPLSSAIASVRALLPLPPIGSIVNY